MAVWAVIAPRYFKMGLKALITATLLVGLLACSDVTRQPVAREGGWEIYLRVSTDGETWDFMEWRPGVHRYQQYGVASPSGAITWSEPVEIDLCLETEIDMEEGRVLWWPRADAPDECFPPEVQANGPPSF